MNILPAVLEAVLESIDDLNELLPAGRRVGKDASSPLFGGETGLESMDLVNLVVSVEDRLRDRLDVSVSLASDRAMSQKTSPFRTVGTLCTFADTLVKEARASG